MPRRRSVVAYPGGRERRRGAKDELLKRLVTECDFVTFRTVAVSEVLITSSVRGAGFRHWLSTIASLPSTRSRLLLCTCHLQSASARRPPRPSAGTSRSFSGLPHTISSNGWSLEMSGQSRNLRQVGA